ncbi:sensor histidine kinase [Inconstantimicrobium mannanitabidum]|uniref:Two-component sensor histidine kinase n=1 Tax=Inconstantimicrobium mannanitabidum TaxID=1604901 RepID=A0ACB5RGU7_9CLOT|nr:HAMP domain-containing sensor histidine kinase [Clostridium sp. TW13]GKX68307.1 two-component sensor histidine kinase [Clostridium sp. TW13]
MIYIVISLIVILIFFIAHLQYNKKQINRIRNELMNINKEKADRKVTVCLLDKNIESLAEEINRTIDGRRESEANRVKFERELRQTIANMSHDLRTPLTSIIGYLQFLKLDDINEEEKLEYLNIAEQRARVLEGLLNDFYELSLIDSIDFQIKCEKVNISRLIEEILLGKYSDFVNRNLIPEVEMCSSMVNILAEEKSLKRVIENLLSNVIKYAKNSVKISLRVEKKEAVFTVSNNVINLTKEDVENIFDRFYMADKTRSGNGTGVGLAVAKALVNKMDGDVSAEFEEEVLSISCRFKLIS